MYRQIGFEFKNLLKLDADAEGCRVLTLEEEEVCLATWRHIMGVLKTTFYRYIEYAAEGQLARKKGNSDLLKPRM
jgi:hypothetical protein